MSVCVYVCVCVCVCVERETDALKKGREVGMASVS